ncbi:MAG: EAL domain-containing protein, partial [Thermoanaerobaculia bacterium]
MANPQARLRAVEHGGVSPEGGFFPDDLSATISLSRFPSGSLTFVTEDARIGRKLRTAAAASGVVQTIFSGALTMDLPEALAERTFRALDELLTEDEHEQVFVFLEPLEGPRLLSLRRLLGLCRDSWFVEFLKSGVFRSHLQPIVDLRKGVAFGFEALLRAERSDGVAVPPLEALRAARATGRLVEFDARARETALHAGASRLGPEDRLFINI